MIMSSLCLTNRGKFVLANQLVRYGIQGILLFNISLVYAVVVYCILSGSR